MIKKLLLILLSLLLLSGCAGTAKPSSPAMTAKSYTVDEWIEETKKSPPPPSTKASSPIVVPVVPPTTIAPAKPPAASDIVYITNSGSKYHRAGCRYLSKSSIPIERSEAIKRYGACSVCKP